MWKVTDRHTAIDYAHTLRDLADVHFPTRRRSAGAGQSQHMPSLYEAFPAAERAGSSSASSGTTPPKHGSLARHGRIELGVLRVAVSRSPLADKQILAHEVKRMAAPPQQAPRQGRLAIQKPPTPAAQS